MDFLNLNDAVRKSPRHYGPTQGCGLHCVTYSTAQGKAEASGNGLLLSNQARSIVILIQTGEPYERCRACQEESQQDHAQHGKKEPLS